ncbi:unnamed protein product [Rangifer tarandus platyrhynchus]|uniref:Uncharacterized protein n=1 Tax=Rangifer tarandus platyrhynchus TaxID=3082113 RepID=A0ABN8ZF25_RANTA|nr:unnamed protein product [Rangifer tarandus platyrhynchus]
MRARTRLPALKSAAGAAAGGVVRLSRQPTQSLCVQEGRSPLGPLLPGTCEPALAGSPPWGRLETLPSDPVLLSGRPWRVPTVARPGRAHPRARVQGAPGPLSIVRVTECLQPACLWPATVWARRRAPRPEPAQRVPGRPPQGPCKYVHFSGPHQRGAVLSPFFMR